MTFLMKMGLFLMLTCCVSAQDVLTNDSILKLSKAGMSDDIILNLIKTGSVQFDLGVEQILALGDAGVSDAVIKAMIDPEKATSPPSVQTAAALDPFTALFGEHKVCVHAETPDGSIIQLEEEVVTHMGFGNALGALKSTSTFGILRMKGKSSVPNKRSPVRISRSETIVVSCGLPENFPLLVLKEKKKKREFVGVSTGFTGAKQESDHAIRLNFEETSPKVYKASLSDLEPGEYGFRSMGTAGGGNLLTFGLQEGAQSKIGGSPGEEKDTVKPPRPKARRTIGSGTSKLFIKLSEPDIDGSTFADLKLVDTLKDLKRRHRSFTIVESEAEANSLMVILERGSEMRSPLGNPVNYKMITATISFRSNGSWTPGCKLINSGFNGGASWGNAATSLMKAAEKCAKEHRNTSSSNSN